jgi:hypothetical protein
MVPTTRLCDSAHLFPQAGGLVGVCRGRRSARRRALAAARAWQRRRLAWRRPCSAIQILSMGTQSMRYGMTSRLGVCHSNVTHMQVRAGPNEQLLWSAQQRTASKHRLGVCLPDT